MSDPKEDAGYAFPAIGDKFTPNGERYVFNEGMTLRDYFAAKAPVEDVNHIMVVRGWNKYGGDLYVEAVTTARYMYADAMIKARNS